LPVRKELFSDAPERRRELALVAQLLVNEIRMHAILRLLAMRDPQAFIGARSVKSAGTLSFRNRSRH